MNTTTFGVGELMRAAIELGCRRLLLGIGGSATVDAGIGCAQATGHTIVLRDGEPVSPTEPLVGADLERVVMIKRHRGEVTDGVEIIVACDVTNPLAGPNGAARIFGPQKGATGEQINQLDNWLRGLALRMGRQSEADVPGAGAAGGLGFGLLAFFGATLQSGIDLVLNATDLRRRLAGADLCLTGEGRLDAQSIDGKAVGGVARLCRETNVPCMAVAGSVQEGLDYRALSLAGAFAIRKPPMTLDDAVRHAAALIESVAGDVVMLPPFRI